MSNFNPGKTTHMSNTNAAELAAKRYADSVDISHKDSGVYVNGGSIGEAIQEAYTAALSTVPKWRVIDGDNLPKPDFFFLRQKNMVSKFYIDTPEWGTYAAMGYTHYLSESDLLTKIEIE